MNVRQFLNSVISAGLKNSPRTRATLSLFPKFFFPEFLRSARVRALQNPLAFGMTIYAIVFFLTFVVQAFFAYLNGVLVPENSGVLLSCFAEKSTCLQYFFGDYANLVNYVFLVEAYCISGCFFLVYENRMGELLSESEFGRHVVLSDAYSPSALGGALAILFALFFVLIGISGYALEIQCYPKHWYMNFNPRSCDAGANIGELRTALDTKWAFAAHYYYVLLNFVLLLFVAFVGTAHFGLFKTAGAISKRLQAVYDSDDAEAASQWLEEERVKKWFAPFATQVLISKIFVLAIVLNMTSWKMWEPSVGAMNDVSVIIIVLVGIWLVTMPRYYIQYHLFKIRQKYDAEVYKDIRMSWILGGSAALDIVLLAIASKILLDTESMVELLRRLFSD